MNTFSKTGLLIAAVLALSACVYDPGYGNVRGNGYYGDTYYGRGSYYDYDYDYFPSYAYPGYYGYTPSVGLGFYYSDHGSHYGHGYSHRGDGQHGHDGHSGSHGHHRRSSH